MFAKLYYIKLRPLGKTNAAFFKKNYSVFSVVPFRNNMFWRHVSDKMGLSKRRKYIHDKKKERLCNTMTKTILFVFTTHTNCPLCSFTNLKRILFFPLVALRPDSGPFPPRTGLWDHSLETSYSVGPLWKSIRPIAETSS